MGLLSEKPLTLNNVIIKPMDIISKLTPPAPKYPEEIQAVLNNGMALEEAAFVVRVSGIKEGKQVFIENYVNSPTLTEAFKLAGITHESYYTGQSAFLFTKMLVNGIIKRTGVFPPEMLEIEERNYFLNEAEKLKITVDRIVTTRLF